MLLRSLLKYRLVLVSTNQHKKNLKKKDLPNHLAFWASNDSDVIPSKFDPHSTSLLKRQFKQTTQLLYQPKATIHYFYHDYTIIIKKMVPTLLQTIMEKNKVFRYSSSCIDFYIMYSSFLQ